MDIRRFWSLMAVLACLLSLAMTGCGGSGSGTFNPGVPFVPFVTPTPTPTPPGVTLQSIQVTPFNNTAIEGSTTRFQAVGVFSNGTTQVLTNEVTWATSGAAATISNASPNNGYLVAGSSAGQVTVTATASGVSGSATLTISAATVVSINLAPPVAVLAEDTGEQLQAVAILSDGTTQNLNVSATWQVTAGPATVSNSPNSQGLVQTTTPTTNPQTATVTASFGGVTSNTAAISVTTATLESITVVPPGPTFAAGQTQNEFSAAGNFSDGTTQDITALVTWASSNSNATISNTFPTVGFVTTVNPGTIATITATLDGVTGGGILNINTATLQSIQVTPASKTIAPNTTESLTAEGVYSDGSTQDLSQSVIWTTSNGNVADVSFTPGSQGTVTAIAAGSTTATATLGSVSGAASVTVTSATASSLVVTPPNPTVTEGRTVALDATAIFADGTVEDVNGTTTYTSSNPSVAFVSENPRGTVTGLQTGTSTITATNARLGVTTTTTVNVTDPGVFTLSITPVNSTLLPGASESLSAVAVFGDATTNTVPVNWTSSNTSVAVVGNSDSDHGKVFALAPGTVTITGTDPISGLSATATVTVSSSTISTLQINPPVLKMAAGTQQQLSATAVLANNTVLGDGVTWGSTNPAVAVISNGSGKGIVTALSPGTTTITATDSVNGATASMALTVSSATLTSLAIDPPPVLSVGNSQSLTLIATFSDDTTQDVTSQGVFTSSNIAAAPVSARGALTATNTGTSTVTASFGGMSATANVDVSTATVVSIAVTAPTSNVPAGTLPVGFNVSLTATGTYSDGTTRDITSQVSWVSGPGANVTTSGTRGTVTGLTASTTPVTIEAVDPATLNFGSLPVTVDSETLTSIAVTVAGQTSNVQVSLGTTPTFTATGTFSSGTTLNLSGQSAWLSTSPSVALVTNNPRGDVFPLSAGTTNIEAIAAGVTGTLPITVGSATLQSIALTPASPTVHQFETKRLTATGTYSNGTVTWSQDISDQVLWQSSAPTLAPVSNNGGNHGIVTAEASSGTSNITATDPVSGVVSPADVVTVTAPL